MSLVRERALIDERADDVVEQPPALLDALFDQLPVGVAVLDRALRLRRCNPTWAGFIGRYTRSWASQAIPGASFFDLAPGSEPSVLPLFRRALAGETVRIDGLRIESGGIVSYWDAVIAPLDEGGRAGELLIATTDATERVLAYQSLERRVAERTAEIERRRQVAEGLRDILAILNSNRPAAELLDAIVAQAAQLFDADAGAIFRLRADDGLLAVQAARGLPDDYVAGAALAVGQGAVGRAAERRAPVARPGPAPDLAGLAPAQRAREARLAARYPAALAVPLIINGALYGALVLYYHVPRDPGAEQVALAVTFADQAALAIENARLRDQVERMAVASERSRLARDLHDSVTQTLFSASLIAEVLPRLWQRSAEDGLRRLEELRQLTRGALAEMRTLLLELRPAALTEVGLGDLLHQLAEATTGRARVPVAVEIAGQAALPPDVQIALYRIAQEALNNVARHAGARRADVRLACAPARVEMAIEDDGRGFELARITPEHLGLRIMRERAESIGAALRVEGRPGRGARIAVVWEPGCAAPERGVL